MTTQEIVSKVKELRELQALIEEAQAEAETTKDAIKANMGGSDVLLAGEYKITWKAVESRRLDTAALSKALPELAAQSYRLCDKGGRVAVYRCGTDGQPEVLVTITGIYTNLLPENDALRIKRGVTVYSERELDLLLEDLGE